MSDLICNDASSLNLELDQNFVPVLTSTSYSLEDIKPFLCEVMKMAGIEDIDPILYYSEEIDYLDISTNFSSLTGVGDPRISLGYVLSAGFNEFFPMALAQVEVIRYGGCQIIDGYICDSDGNKKKETRIECPSNFSMTPITSQQIANRTLEIIQTGIENHAEKFVQYLKLLEKDGWQISLYYYQNFSIFYVRLDKGSGTRYLKYYPDAREIVSNSLNKNLNIRTDSFFDNEDHFNAIKEIIPNY